MTITEPDGLDPTNIGWESKATLRLRKVSNSFHRKEVGDYLKQLGFSVFYGEELVYENGVFNNECIQVEYLYREGVRFQLVTLKIRKNGKRTNIEELRKIALALSEEEAK